MKDEPVVVHLLYDAGRHRILGKDSYDRLAFDFLFNYLTEAVYTLSEQTQGRLRSRDLVAILDLIGQRVLAAS